MKFVCLLSIIGIVAAASLTACNDNSDPGDTSTYVYYRQDRRTGICFAVAGHGLATVPCSSEVQVLIPKPYAPQVTCQTNGAKNCEKELPDLQESVVSTELCR